MNEASDNKYFIDGFLIKHFGIWPTGFDKENLLEEQKKFLIYLMGIIPSLDSWSIQVDYEFKLEEIKKINDIEINQSEIDLAKLHDKDLDELKKEKIKKEKENKIKKLNESFGIKEEKKNERIKDLPEYSEEKNETPTKKLWDILQLRGLTTNG